MAQNYKYSRVQYDTFNITGELSANGSTITYVNENDVESTITVATCFDKFKGKPITLTILSKSDLDLTSEFEDNDDT